MIKNESSSLKGLESSLFLVGKDARGNWVVLDQSGLCGGLFVGRDEALKFARTKNRNRSQAVRMVCGILELDLSVKPGAGRATSKVQASHRRVA